MNSLCDQGLRSAKLYPGERPLGVSEDSGSLKRFSEDADGFF